MRSRETSRRVLGRGTVVSIVGETEDGEWGSGLARAWAQVQGHSRDGWYAGVLEDGSPVEFHEDQIEGLLEERAGLSGIRDWFGKKPQPGSTGQPALPHDPGGSIIYVGPTGVARYEEAPAFQKPKGFLKSIQESVSSMVDAFKGTTSLAPRPETPLTPYEKKPSMFAAFAPGAPKPMQAWQERATAFMLPKCPGLLAPFVESAKEIFEFVEPSPEPETYEARTAHQHELWTGMFPETKEGPSLFEVFNPSEVIMPEDAALPPEMRAEIDKGSIEAVIIPLPRRNTVLPTPEEVARGLLLLYDPITEKIFNGIRADRESEDFQRNAALCMKRQMPAMIEVFELATCGSSYACGVIDDEHMAVAALLQIPWDYVESKTRREWVTEGGERYLEVVNNEELNEDIFMPAHAIVREAFDLIKPEDLPGSFTIDYDLDDGHLSLIYSECDEQPGGAPGEGPGEAFEEDAGESFDKGEAAEQEEELFYEAPVVAAAPKKKPKNIKKAKKAKKK